MANSPRIRHPLAQLPNGSFAPSSSPHGTSQHGLNEVLKSNEAADSVSDLNDLIDSPAEKKSKTVGKRVSFGGDMVKIFHKDIALDHWDQSPPKQSSDSNYSSRERQNNWGDVEYNITSQRSSPRARDKYSSQRKYHDYNIASESFPSEADTNSSMFPNSVQPLSPRRSPRLLKRRKSISSPLLQLQNDGYGSDKSENEDTVTLPHVDDMLRDQVDLSEAKMSPVFTRMQKEYEQSPTLSPHALFMDEDVTVGVAAPRISTHGGNGGDDTTMLIPFHQVTDSSPNVPDQRRNSTQSNISDGDITQQIPGMNGLIDMDEAYRDDRDRCLENSQENELDTHNNFNFSPDGATLTIGDVTSFALPLAKLVEDDTIHNQSIDSNINNGDDSSPKNPSPGSDSSQSMGDITIGVPSLHALAENDAIDHPPIPSADFSLDQNREKSSPRTESKHIPESSFHPCRPPVLPESRQLFKGDPHPDDDTLHYQEQALKPKSTGLRDAQQIRRNESPEVPTKSNVESSLRMPDVLDMLLIQFRDDFKSVQRGPSLGVGLDGDTNLQRAKVEEEDPCTKLYDSVRSALKAQTVLKILESSVTELREEILKRQAQTSEFTGQIERYPPEYFTKLERGDKLKPGDLSKLQLDFKRLRKASAMQAAKQHALLRMERETGITAAMCNQIAGLDVDLTVLRKSLLTLTAESEKVEDAITKDGLDEYVAEAASSHIDPVLTESLRSEVTSHLEALRSAQAQIQQARENRTRLAAENKALLQANTSLRQEEAELRKYAEASTPERLRTLVDKHRDAHLLLTAMTGIKPVSISHTEIRVILLDLVEVTFNISQDSVNMAASSVVRKFPPDMSSIFGQFFTRFVSIVSENIIKKVSSVHDIPAALQLSVTCIMHLLDLHHDFTRYERVREASFVEVESTSVNPSCAEIRLAAEYFSTEKRCKFKATFSVLAFAPRSLSDYEQSVVVDVQSVDGIIGSHPSLDEIRAAAGLHTGGSANGNSRMQSLFNILQTVWTLL